MARDPGGCMTTFNEANVATPESMIEALRHDSRGSSIMRVLSILEKAYEASSFAGSVANCHVPGVYSIVLFSDPELGMIRFYYQPKFSGKLSSLTDNKGSFNLGVHNHSFDIAKVPITGQLANVRFKEADPYGVAPMKLKRYFSYSTLRAGETMSVEFELPEIEVLRPGEATVMEASDLHTVVTGKTGATAWMVFEGPPKNNIPSYIYSTDYGFEVSSEGLCESVSYEDSKIFTQAMIGYIKESL